MSIYTSKYKKSLHAHAYTYTRTCTRTRKDVQHRFKNLKNKLHSDTMIKTFNDRNTIAMLCTETTTKHLS